MATGLPSQKQVIELLDDEFARAGYEIEEVVIREAARPPKITVIADGDQPLDLDTIARLSRSASKLLDTLDRPDTPDTRDTPDTSDTPDTPNTPHTRNTAAATARYVLEVSSPGVDRPLTSEKHFRRARGRKVDLTLTDGTQLTGRLAGTADGQLRLVVRQTARDDWTVRHIPLADIAKGVVQVEFSPPHPRERQLVGEGDEEAGR